jgi:hypothetical protein
VGRAVHSAWVLALGVATIDFILGASIVIAEVIVLY